MLEIRSLTSAYGGIVAVRDTSLRVAARSMRRAEIGSNGAGKTTLLHPHSVGDESDFQQCTFRDTVITGQTPLPRGAQGHAAGAGRPWPPGAAVGTRSCSTSAVFALGARAGGPYANLEAVLPLFPRLAERLEQLAGWLGGDNRCWRSGAPDGFAGAAAADEPCLGSRPDGRGLGVRGTEALQWRVSPFCWSSRMATRAGDGRFAYVMERVHIVDEG